MLLFPEFKMLVAIEKQLMAGLLGRYVMANLWQT
jgi:hypothetical protein